MYIKSWKGSIDVAEVAGKLNLLPLFSKKPPVIADIKAALDVLEGGLRPTEPVRESIHCAATVTWWIGTLLNKDAEERKHAEEQQCGIFDLVKKLT